MEKLDVKKKCITISADQDKKIRAIQMRRMANTSTNVSYSSVIREAITKGLDQIE